MRIRTHKRNDSHFLPNITPVIFYLREATIYEKFFSTKMPKVYFKPALMTNLLKSDFILTTIATLLILQFGTNGIQFVSGSTTTPYPDANARPTIASKLENYLSPSNITTTTTGYLNVYNGNDSYGKFTTAFIEVIFGRFHSILLYPYKKKNYCNYRTNDKGISSSFINN